jgi:hypothetical protein
LIHHSANLNHWFEQLLRRQDITQWLPARQCSAAHLLG